MIRFYTIQNKAPKIYLVAYGPGRLACARPKHSTKFISTTQANSTRLPITKQAIRKLLKKRQGRHDKRCPFSFGLRKVKVHTFEFGKDRPVQQALFTTPAGTQYSGTANSSLRTG